MPSALIGANPGFDIIGAAGASPGQQGNDIEPGFHLVAGHYYISKQIEGGIFAGFFRFSHGLTIVFIYG